MDLIICFIDDSDYEHELVRKEIAPSCQDLRFIQSYTFEEARKIMGEEIPILFLLDLWGQDLDVTEPFFTSLNELKERASGFNSLEDVFKGIYEFQGDRNNEYLKRLFTIVDSWRKMFEDTCNRIGQNRKYGLENLRQARLYYPGVPAVFYTRKSLINDAVAMFKANADGLFIKPTGCDESETRLLTREFAPQLIKELSQIIDSKIENLRNFKSIYSSDINAEYGKVDALISSWKEFINK